MDKLTGNNGEFVIRVDRDDDGDWSLTQKHGSGHAFDYILMSEEQAQQLRKILDATLSKEVADE